MEATDDDTRLIHLVARGYDQMAERYASWAGAIDDAQRERHVRLLLERLPEGASVLELGCGGGDPTTLILADRFALTGVDVSATQIARARQAIPGGTFVHADVTKLELPADRFDAVVAFYMLTHIPRRLLPGLLHSVSRWLRPGGLFCGTMGTADTLDALEPDWLGVPMMFSGYNAMENRQLIERAGLTIEHAEDHSLDEADEAVARFLWVVARR
ncbi:MAG: class I SAM-dependent DNA methyltransferase [Thermomicrobiales bacterium]